MIRYKILCDLRLLHGLSFTPTTILTYSIEVETCNTGMVAVTRKIPLSRIFKNNKANSSREENVAVLDNDSPSKNQSHVFKKKHQSKS